MNRAIIHCVSEGSSVILDLDKRVQPHFIFIILLFWGSVKFYSNHSPLQPALRETLLYQIRMQTLNGALVGVTIRLREWTTKESWADSRQR